MLRSITGKYSSICGVILGLLSFFILIPVVSAQHTGTPDAGYADKLFNDGKHESALIAYRQIYERDPDNYTARFRVGLLLGWTGQYNEAISHLSAMYEDLPQDNDVGFALIRVLSWDGQFGKALRLISDIQRQSPRNAEAHALEAQIYFWQGRMAKSWRKTNDVLDLDDRQELAKTLRSSMRDGLKPEILTYYRRPWDSDRTLIHSFGQTAVTGLYPGTQLGLGWNVTNTQNRITVQNFTRSAVNIHALHQINRSWWIQAGTGASIFNNVPNSGARVNANLNVQYRSGMYSVIGFLNRYSLSETPRLIELRTMLTEAGVTGMWNHSVQRVYAQFDYGIISDQNSRLSFATGYQYDFVMNDITLTPGIRLNWRSFEEAAIGRGYFAPEWFQSGGLTLRASWDDPELSWYIQSDVEIGGQRFKEHNLAASDPTFRYLIGGFLGYRPFDRLDVEAGYQYSNLIGIASFSDAATYWSQFLELRIRYRPGKLITPFVPDR